MHAVPTNLSVLSPASSPDDKVPRNWRVGPRCCLCRTMTCRNCAKITLGKKKHGQLRSPRRRSEVLLLVLLLLHSPLASRCAPRSVFLRTSPAVCEEVLSSFSPLCSYSRRRAASAWNIMEAAPSRCVCGRCCEGDGT